MQSKEQEIDCKTFAESALQFNISCCELLKPYDQQDVKNASKVKVLEWVKQNPWFEDIKEKEEKRRILFYVYKDKLSKIAGLVDENTNEFNLEHFTEYVKTNNEGLIKDSEMLISFAKKCVTLMEKVHVKEVQYDKTGLTPQQLNYEPRFILRCINLNFINVSIK